jgi:hypothetical protein
LDGEYKVAQYCQWDGYPSGQGATILSFLNKEEQNPKEQKFIGLDKGYEDVGPKYGIEGLVFDPEKFKAAVRNCSFASEEDLKDMNESVGIGRDQEWVNMEEAARFKAKFPQIDRDMGGWVLAFVQHTDGCVLNDSIDFAADSLFCEWAYVVDLDRNTFEVHEGFNKRPSEGRFADMDYSPDHRDDKYFPVTLVAEWSLDDLPTEAEFLAKLEPQEEDDDE